VAASEPGEVVLALRCYYGRRGGFVVFGIALLLLAGGGQAIYAFD